MNDQANFESKMAGVLPKTAGTGLKVDETTPTFPWRDLIGLIQPDVTTPSTTPDMVEFITGVKAYQFDAGDIVHCVFHIPHDWVPDSDAEIHLHFGIGTAETVANTCSFAGTVTYGSRDSVFGSPVTLDPITYTADSSNNAQYSHPVIEVPLCRASPSANELDSNDIEVDGLVVVSFVAGSMASMTASPFIFTADIHYQSTGIGTKNNASPFYT